MRRDPRPGRAPRWFENTRFCSPATYSRDYPCGGSRNDLPSLAPDPLLEPLARAERGQLHGRDRQRFACLGIAALTRSPLPGVERAETGDGEITTGIQLDRDDPLARLGREDRIDHLVRLRLRNVGLARQLFSELVLRHRFPPFLMSLVSSSGRRADRRRQPCREGNAATDRCLG